MFKNLIVYRVGPEWQPDLMAALAALDKERFVECGATQPLSSGWVEPRGVEHAPLVELIAGQWLLKLMVEQKVLPGAVIRRRCDEIAAHIELTTGRKPGKKQIKELKEQAQLELLPQAFTRQSAVRVWIDPDARLLMLDVSSSKRAEEVVTQLVKALQGFNVRPLQTTMAPATAMALWLSSGEAPQAFSVDRECELKSADEMKSVVRYARHALDIDEVREHIAAGKQPTRLAMTWHGRVSFVLTEAMQIKRLAFDDVVFESTKGSKNHADDGFDTDAAIATGELSQLIPDLINALDGELQPGEMPAELTGKQAVPGPSATAPTAPTPASATAGADDDSPPWN
jgi:recombination associated protein RdgC